MNEYDKKNMLDNFSPMEYKHLKKIGPIHATKIKYAFFFRDCHRLQFDLIDSNCNGIMYVYIVYALYYMVDIYMFHFVEFHFVH